MASTESCAHESTGARLDRIVIGQAKAKEDLRHAFLRRECRTMMLEAGRSVDECPAPLHVLLTGPTGSGKTLLVETLAREFAAPTARIDATTLTATGYHGLSVADAVAGLLAAANEDIASAERGVLFLDEIDKLARSGDDGAAVRTTSVQHELLKVLDGKTLELVHRGRIRKFETRGVLVVGAGAFAGIDEISDSLRKATRGGIGFVADQLASTRDAAIEDSDLIEFGMLPELVGRFSIRSKLDPLKLADLAAIVSESAASPLRSVRSVLHHHGIALTVTGEACEVFARKAIKLGLGARGLVNAVQACVRDLELGLDSLLVNGVTEVVIDAEVASGASPAKVGRRSKRRVHRGSRAELRSSDAAFEDRTGAPERPARVEGGTHGSWGLASEPDLAKVVDAKAEPFQTRVPGVSPLVEVTPDGSELAIRRNRDLTLSAELRCRHILAVGPTGSGKSTSCILPILASDLRDPGRSVVVLDTTGELAKPVLAMTRRYRGEDARFVYLDPTDPVHSVGWNPLAGVRDESDALKTASGFIYSVPTGMQESPFWDLCSVQLLGLLIEGLALLSDGDTPPDMRTAMRLLDGGQSGVARFAAQNGLDDLRSACERMLDNVNGNTTMMHLIGKLNGWRDKDVQAVTSVDELDLDSLHAEPFVLVLRIPLDRTRELLPITNAFVARLLNVLLRAARLRGGALANPVSLILDEFASAIGKLEDLPSRINVLRKAGISLTAAVQSISQIRSTYGSEASELLAGFNSLWFLPGVTFEDAQFASERSGFISVQEVTEGTGGAALSIRPVMRPLLLPIEVSRPRPHPELGSPSTLLLADTRPFQAYVSRSYQMESLAFLRSPEFAALEIPARTKPLKVSAVLSRVTESAPVTRPSLAGISNVSGWSDDRLRDRLGHVKQRVGFDEARGSARKWWLAFEQENAHRLPLVLRLAEELLVRRATITEFFLAYCYSNTDNIQANLSYLDYSKLKKQEEEKKREATGAA